MKENKFGEYKFDTWVPEHIREQIRDFWGQMGRTHEDWLKNSCEGVSEVCYHGPNPNGFRIPPYAARVIYLLRNYELSKKEARDVYDRIEGNYIHAWNNIGRVVHKDGTYSVVSSCDMWVRVWKSDEEKEIALS